MRLSLGEKTNWKNVIFCLAYWVIPLIIQSNSKTIMKQGHNICWREAIANKVLFLKRIVFLCQLWPILTTEFLPRNHQIRKKGSLAQPKELFDGREKEKFRRNSPSKQIRIEKTKEAKLISIWRWKVEWHLGSMKEIFCCQKLSLELWNKCRPYVASLVRAIICISHKRGVLSVKNNGQEMTWFMTDVE